MNILLVTELFPPDKGVSTLRMELFYEKLLEEHIVDVLKLSNNNFFDGNIKTVERTLFKTFLVGVFNRYKIIKLLSPLIIKYDLIIVSATPYQLYEVANVAKMLSVPYILDLRDLPDLTTSEQLGTKPLFWLMFKSWLINIYIQSIAVKSVALLCVGCIATALLQHKYKKRKIKIINVHNGFNIDDLRLVNENVSALNRKICDEINIACVGNIYNFRDTIDLRKALLLLNDKNRKINILHWGKISYDLYSFLEKLENVFYVPRKPVLRKQLLIELLDVDCFLLACSDDLVWEPTTSVFDYILYDKPVIFTGLRNNEAYCILENTQMTIVETEKIMHFELSSSACKIKTIESLITYSREFNYIKLNNIIKGMG
jgi:glycosyltransferase involved in cell wall biosynthesis